MKKQIPVLIDVDTGTDDAIALVLACADKNIDIKGVTTVAGNVALENTTRNTLNVMHLLGRGDVSVAQGAAAPLKRRLMKASGVHGLTGLRGYTFEQNTTAALSELPAYEFLYRALSISADRMTLIVLGPMTNIAVLLQRHPDAVSMIERIVFMGTSYHDGNPSPIATFNVLVDPEAFRQVIHSGVPVYAMPLETTRKGYFSPEDIEAIRNTPGIGAHFTTAVLQGYGHASQEELEALAAMPDEEEHIRRGKKSPEPDVAVHDLITVAFVTNPELFAFTKYFCDVECKGELTTGFTLIDMANWYGKTEEEKNLYYIDAIDREGFVKVFMQALRSYD